VIVGTAATTTVITRRVIIATALAHICGLVVGATHRCAVIGTEGLTDMTGRIITAAALANMAGGIIGTLPRNRWRCKGNGAKRDAGYKASFETLRHVISPGEFEGASTGWT
jgi:hypothetical protein